MTRGRMGVRRSSLRPVLSVRVLAARLARRVRRAAWLGLVALLLAPAVAHAQSPQLSLQATPSPFLPSATINLQADVTIAVQPDTWCVGWPQGTCQVLSIYTSAQVTRPGGFSAFSDSWNWTDTVTVQTTDTGPGQTQQATTYTLTGMVVVTYCDWDPFLGDCATAPEEYVEWGQTQQTVVPYAVPSADAVSPSSGSGLTQTFTLTYSSAGGAGDVADMRVWIFGASSPLTGGDACYVRYVAASHSLGLYTDDATDWTWAPVGSATGVQNSQCAVNTAAAGASASGNQWTVTVPITFNSAWVGERYVYMIALSASGVSSQWQHRGHWTVPCTAQVTPDRVQLGAGSGNLSFSISTPAGCGWTAPTTSEFLSRTSPGSGTGPGQVAYDYTANGGVQLRVTAPEIAGQSVTVTQLAAPPADVLYYHSDALGSVRAITGTAGQVVATADFLPFGDDWQATGDLDSQGFAGMERTWHTGIASWGPLNYAGARYYHSQSGRFTSPDDPSYIDPLNPQTWNLYAYVMNNPLRWVDPSGHQAQCTPGPGHFCGGVEEIDWSRFDAYWGELDLREFWGNAWRSSIEYWRNWHRQHEAEMARQEQIGRECFSGGSCEGLQIMMAGTGAAGAGGVVVLTGQFHHAISSGSSSTAGASSAKRFVQVSRSALRNAGTQQGRA